MGLSGGSQKTTYTPNPAQTAAASAVAGQYGTSAPAIQDTSNQLLGLLPGLTTVIPQTQAGVSNAAAYDNDVLGGKYLSPSSNPALAAMLTMNDNAVTDTVNSQFGAAGRTGSGGQAYALARGVGDVNNSLLESNYNAERQAQTQAAANAGTLNSSTLGSALSLGSTAALLPLQAADQYASGIGSLGLGGTSTVTGSPSLLSDLGGLVGIGTGIAGLGGSLGLWNLKKPGS